MARSEPRVRSSTFRHPLGEFERIPQTCVWAITQRCDVGCIHCDRHTLLADPGELSLERMTGVAEELEALGCERVHLTGGEPLLFPQWQDLCGVLKRMRLKVTLATHGVWGAETLERLVATGIDELRVSLDGLAEIHNRTRRSLIAPETDCFARAVTTIKAAARRLPVRVITQINQDNLRQLLPLGRLLKTLGAARWQLQLAMPSESLGRLERPYVCAPEQLPLIGDFVASARRDGDTPPIEVSDTIGYFGTQELALRGSRFPLAWFGCNAGVRLVSIGATGRVSGCSVLPREFDAGSLHERSLSEIWRDGTRFGYVTQFETAALSGGCAACAFGQACRAGCRALAYLTTGSIYENRHCLRLLETRTREIGVVP